MSYASAIIVDINTKAYYIAFLEDGQYFLKDSTTENLLLKMILFYLYRKAYIQKRRDNIYFWIKNWFIPGNIFDVRNEIFVFYIHFALCILAFLYLSCMLLKKNHFANILLSPHLQQTNAIKNLNLISVIRAIAKHFYWPPFSWRIEFYVCGL